MPIPCTARSNNDFIQNICLILGRGLVYERIHFSLHRSDTLSRLFNDFNIILNLTLYLWDIASIRIIFLKVLGNGFRCIFSSVTGSNTLIRSYDHFLKEIIYL